MLFETTDRVKAALPKVREFVREELVPLEKECVGAASFREMVPRLQEKRQEVKALGLWAPHMPESLGGMGLSLMEFAVLSEAMGFSPLGHYAFNCQAPDAGNMEILKDHGTEAQQERWLKRLAAGEIRSCFSMTEPEFAGSNPVNMGTTAVKDGDDYVINGGKFWTTNGTQADWMCLLANTSEGAPHKNKSLICMPMDAPPKTPNQRTQ